MLRIALRRRLALFDSGCLFLIATLICPNDQIWLLNTREGLPLTKTVASPGYTDASSWQCPHARAERMQGLLDTVTANHYRLPTESEWEYAARSGNKDEIWAGTSDESQLSEYAVTNTDKTEPVGSRKPNGFGLYDMTGNVWEWVEDCWHTNYEEGPTDGSPWLQGNGGACGRRVIRGGSLFNTPVHLRASNRGAGGIGAREDGLGFRLVQDWES